MTLSRLSQPHIGPGDFLEFGVDLEELSVTFANLQSIKSNAFKYVHGLKHIDLSDNNIGTIENNAFVDVSWYLKIVYIHTCLYEVPLFVCLSLIHFVCLRC